MNLLHRREINRAEHKKRDFIILGMQTMEYLFENLGPERFQEFCHCLISNEYPHSQSFPIGMPDGGRDSVVYTWGSGKREFIVFQVKYVRDPSALEDRYQWLANVLEEEAKKCSS